MPIDLQTEEVLSLTDATKALPLVDGKRPHVSTLWRWCKVGVRGVCLEYVRLGNRIVTTRGALARFAHALAEADPEPGSIRPRPTSTRRRRRSERQRQRDIERAERALDKAGVGRS